MSMPFSRSEQKKVCNRTQLNGLCSFLIGIFVFRSGYRSLCLSAAMWRIPCCFPRNDWELQITRCHVVMEIDKTDSRIRTHMLHILFACRLQLRRHTGANKMNEKRREIKLKCHALCMWPLSSLVAPSSFD